MRMKGENEMKGKEDKKVECDMKKKEMGGWNRSENFILH